MRISIPVLLALLVVCSFGCKKNAEVTSTGDGGGTVAPVSDLDRLQGVWAIESFDYGDATQKLSFDIKTNEIRTQFVGNEMATLARGKLGNRLSFTLQENAEPKVMTITYLGEDGQPMRPGGPNGPIPGGKPALPRDWIYKFDGEFLVVAQPDYAVFETKEMKRPVNFTAIPSSFKDGQPPVNGVTITRLRKTNEKPVPVATKK